MKLVRRLYDWTLSLASRPRAEGWLAAISFIESSFFPIPPDVALIPMCIARPARALRYAFICTAASVAGGLFGYAIGHLLFESIGRPIIEFYGAAAIFDSFQQKFNNWGAWIILVAGVTPIPYKIATIAAGAAGMNVPAFIATSVVGRAARFYLVAWLLWKYGAPIQGAIEKYLNPLGLAFFILLVGGFFALGNFL